MIDFGNIPGDKEIEISLDHRTLITVKNPGRSTVLEICIVGSPGARADLAMVDMEPGKGYAIDVYENDPKKLVSLLSLPIAEFEKDLKRENPRGQKSAGTATGPE
jgi:hypothetical protein